MTTSSSLRAQRSNPAVERATGLPRRSAPRNDGFLCGFAASREAKEEWGSREAAKARRKLEIVVASFLLTIGCSSGQESQQESEARATEIVGNEHPTSPAAGCFDKADISEKKCIANELKKQETQVNATLQLIRDQGAYPIEDVLNAQKAWRAFADLECRQRAKLGLDPPDPSYCLVDMLSERRAELYGYVID